MIYIHIKLLKFCKKLFLAYTIDWIVDFIFLNYLSAFFKYTENYKIDCFWSIDTIFLLLMISG
jgi:hypothetical protein